MHLRWQADLLTKVTHTLTKFMPLLKTVTNNSCVSSHHNIHTYIRPKALTKPTLNRVQDQMN